MGFKPCLHSSLPVATLGAPRIGPRRELKLALESYWSSKSDENAYLATRSALRAANWARQKALGVTIVPSNDFSLYDHVLDTTVMVGAIPDGYGWIGGPVLARDLFCDGARLASRRGHEAGVPDHAGEGHVHSAAAQEMTKWFDTTITTWSGARSATTFCAFVTQAS
jgi:5-methyltetrahydropteroyltriglutamate--homocysteine methyltransferase